MTTPPKNPFKTDSKIKNIAMVIYALIASGLSAKYIALHGIEVGDVLAIMAAIFVVPAAFLLQKWRREGGDGK